MNRLTRTLKLERNVASYGGIWKKEATADEKYKNRV